MPDFERVFDTLRVDLACTPDEKARAEGYIAGKRYARKEIVIVVAVCTILLICGMFMGQAGAVDFIDFVRHNDRGDHITLPAYVEGVTATPDDEVVIDLDEIRALLERCREFVRDNDKPINEIDVTLSVYIIESRKSLASAEVRKAQEVVERLERETDLRRDIEEMLGRFTHVHGAE